MDTVFTGEHLVPGHIGQFFIVLAFGSALLSTISYYFSTTNPHDNSWRNLGRIGAVVNFISVIGIGASLYYIIGNYYYEYHYAWAHSSRTLPVYFIISSFWDG